MKFLFVLLLSLAAANTAIVDNTLIDWSTVKPIWSIPEFVAFYPKLSNVYKLNNHFDGTEKTKPFVVGGEPAPINQFTYTTALVLHFGSGNGFCSGSVITSRFVMTAAHCIQPVSSVVVVVNGNDLNNPLEPGQRRLFSEDLRSHADFQDNDVAALNDIGVVRLPEDLTFSSTFQPIRLASVRQIGQSFNNFLATISGFGSTESGSQTISTRLHFVRSPVILNLSCRLSFPITGIHGSQVCVSGDGGRGPCSGDSGAPVTVLEGDGISTQIGIVSWGSILGCDNSQPSVNTRLTEFLSWIAENSDYVLS